MQGQRGGGWMQGCSIPAQQVSWGWDAGQPCCLGPRGSVCWVLTAHTPPRPPGKGGCDPAAPSLPQQSSPQGTELGLARGQTPAVGIHLWLLLGETPMQPPTPSWPDQVPKPLPTHTLSQESPMGSKGCWQGGDHFCIGNSHLGTAPQLRPGQGKGRGAGNP